MRGFADYVTLAGWVLALACMIFGGATGGFAIVGRVENGRYYIVYGSEFTQVSRQWFTLSGLTTLYVGLFLLVWCWRCWTTTPDQEIFHGWQGAIGFAVYFLVACYLIVQSLNVVLLAG